MTQGQPSPIPTGVTFHLVPTPVWEANRAAPTYEPEGFADEGFVHCTNGLDMLLVPANAYYHGDPRPYLALAIDLAAIESPVRYDDEACVYPHIYGPIDTVAVTAVFEAERAEDGTFVGFTPSC